MQCMMLFVPKGKKMPATMFAILFASQSACFFTIALCSVYYFLYHFEFAFIEQYRIEKDKPWPWYIDEEAHRTKVIKALKWVLFNNIFTNAIISIVYAYFYNWSFTFIDIRPETVPGAWVMFK